MKGGDIQQPTFLKIYKGLDKNELAMKQKNNAVLLQTIIMKQNSKKYNTGEILDVEFNNQKLIEFTK
jgi:hypothetical protein